MKREFRRFVPLTKYDAAMGVGEGVLALEEIDSSGERMDYASSKPFFEAWSADVYEKSRGKSRGNLRRQHDEKKAVGKFTDMIFDDEAKAVRVKFKVTDPLTKSDCAEGVLTGLSIGGFYERMWEDEYGVWCYTARPIEGSVVDRPAMPNATFVFKAENGVEEERGFSNVREIRQVWTCGWEDCDEIHVAKADAVRCSGLAKNEEEEKTMEEQKPDEVETAIAETIAETPPAEEPKAEPEVVTPETTETAEKAPESVAETPAEPSAEPTPESAVESEEAPNPAESEPLAAAADAGELRKEYSTLAKTVETLAEVSKSSAARIDGIERALAELTALLTKAVSKPETSKAAQRPAVSPTAVEATKEKKAGEENVDDLFKASLSEPRPVFLSR